MRSFAMGCLSILSGLFAAAALAAPRHVGDGPARLDRIFSDYADEAAPGCAVGVYERGKLVQMKGYGAADVATGAPMTADTLFYAASISKQFTSLAVALLVQDGKLQLTDDVRKWIPELPDYGTPITVEMLMHHTSGVRDFLGLLDLAGRDTYDQLDIPTALGIITRQRGLNFTPGTKYWYSNGGYFLLAQLVARVSGEPFHEFTQRRIFAPLGMKHTFFRHGPNPSGTHAAHGYVPDGKSGFSLADGYPSVSGSGGLMVSLGDLARYDQDFHVGHKVWSERVRKIMLTPGTFTNGEKVAVNDEGSFFYAAGLNVGVRRGQEWVAHSGGATGFKSQYVRLPGLKFSVAAFCNRGDASPGPLVEKVIEAFHGEALTAAVPDGPQPIEERIAGRFHSDELDADYVFARKGDGLEATVTSAYAMEPRTTSLEKVALDGRGVLSLDIGDLQLEFAPDRRVSAFTTLDSQISGIRFVRVQ